MLILSLHRPAWATLFYYPTEYDYTATCNKLKPGTPPEPIWAFIITSSLLSESELQKKVAEKCQNKKVDFLGNTVSDGTIESINPIPKIVKIPIDKYYQCTGKWECELSCYESSPTAHDSWCRTGGEYAPSSPHMGATYNAGTMTAIVALEKDLVKNACVANGMPADYVRSAGAMFRSGKCQECLLTRDEDSYWCHEIPMDSIPITWHY